MARQRLRETIARQESVRRSRDRAWMIFAAYFVAALFLWWVVASALRAPAAGWSAPLLAYIALAAIVSALAVRGLLKARKQDRRLAEARKTPVRPGPADEPK